MLTLGVYGYLLGRVYVTRAELGRTTLDLLNPFGKEEMFRFLN